LSTTSRIAVVEDALYDILVAQAANGASALFNVPVFPTNPGIEMARECAWIGTEVLETQEWETTGLGSQQKMETTPVRVMFRSQDVDYPTVRARVFALAGALEDAIRADAHLGVGAAQVFDSDILAMQKDAWQQQDGWVVSLRVTVRARSLLS
jgi:hypothetical protein